LVVEDDPQLRELYRRTLMASRYKVSLAADGLTALTSIETELPDVVVLDLGLPRISGWDVYRDLRARQETRTLPIILATGQELRDIPLADLACVLDKPIEPVRLLAAVDSALCEGRNLPSVGFRRR
jgi:DNA-binding response OmpR family regulator